MNEVWLSGIGILLALAGMTLLIFRRVSPIIVGPLAALLVTLLSRLPVLETVTGTYVQGVGSFFVSYFMIFLLGAAELRRYQQLCYHLRHLSHRAQAL